MTRRYARGPRGKRVHDARPVNYGPNLTIIGALTLNGLLTTMAIPGATTGDVFLAFITEFLCPVLRPGQFVVMDNLSAHRVDGVAQAIESIGAHLVYLPPYSPDLNPIESAWSKLKNGLRTIGARTIDGLVEAIGRVIPQLTPSDCRGWFNFCGYDPST